MPRFSSYFHLRLSQHQLDFVDINTDKDTPVYVDPYAIEVRDDVWAAGASEHIRTFFTEVLDALRSGDDTRAHSLMSNLREPRETFLGVSQPSSTGRGVGSGQALKLISAIRRSEAYKSGLLSDLSEMALYVEGIDRDKISDLTTNIIRKHLIHYTQSQCSLFGIATYVYGSPPIWSMSRRNWIAEHVMLPMIGDKHIILVPKYIVRRRLSLDSQDFYNKQITSFLVQENLRANSSLVQTLKSGKRVVPRKSVQKENPKSKSFIAEMVLRNPGLLDSFKEVARKQGVVINFTDDDESENSVADKMINVLKNIPTGASSANDYHNCIVGIITLLFFPNLIAPSKEWEINGGRKRIDIVFTNAADSGFFSQRRDDSRVSANLIVIECKNYSKDLTNPEIDQLIGRFSEDRGKFGIVVCREIDDKVRFTARCKDAVHQRQGYIIYFTDNDIIYMLDAKAKMNDSNIEAILYKKYAEIIS